MVFLGWRWQGSDPFGESLDISLPSRWLPDNLASAQLKRDKSEIVLCRLCPFSHAKISFLFCPLLLHYPGHPIISSSIYIKRGRRDGCLICAPLQRYLSSGLMRCWLPAIRSILHQLPWASSQLDLMIPTSWHQYISSQMPRISRWEESWWWYKSYLSNRLKMKSSSV